MLFPTKLLSGMLSFIIFPHDGKGCDVMNSRMCWKPGICWQMLLPMLVWLLVELIIVLMLGTTIVVTDVKSLEPKMLCGYLLIWFKVLQNQCVHDRCCVTGVKMLCCWCYGSSCTEPFCMWHVMSPKPWCYLACLPEPKLRWIHQYLIQYVWQLVFVYISIKGWVMNSDENGFFDGSCKILIFSAYSA